MAGGFTFEDIMFLCIFFLCVWLGGKAFALTGGTPLVGEILIGMLLGPPLADIVPFPNAVMLAGEVGLLLLITEAGIYIYYRKLICTFMNRMWLFIY